jgi:hypothetical protein
VSGGADYECFAMFGTKHGNCARGGVRAEVDDDIGLRQDGFKVVALVNLADELKFRVLRGAGDQGFAHAPF